MTDVRPAPGVAADASAALEFTLRTSDEAGVEPDAVTVRVDGEDVTEACRVRVPRLWPVNRADFAYRPPAGWEPGGHTVSVSWPGRMVDASWTFEVRRAPSG